MCPVPSLLILSPEPWTQCDQDLSARSSDQTTLSSVRVVLETTGPKVITQKVLNLSIPSSMLYAKNLNPAIGFQSTHSFGGGTESGMRTLLISKILTRIEKKLVKWWATNYRISNKPKLKSKPK